MADDDLLRRLPQLQRVLERQDAAALQASFGRAAVTEALRTVIDDVRRRVRGGGLNALPSPDMLVAAAAAWLEERQRPHLVRVINATGIVLHTNLGRAPLAAGAMAAAVEVGQHYSNLEFDLANGSRGSRTTGIEGLLRTLTGAEAALAVNNGAAAILLALAALGAGGEVIVSRGELVEIGGGFRVPDVIRQGGATLVEVGATNKTRAADYRAALGERTRVLLKVHQSNFRITGFTAETSIRELAEVARDSGALVVADVGSGLLQATPGIAEPTLREALAAGADLVTCSGDKLLGGPQAGLIVGREAAVAPLRMHPLLRAVRLDKLSLAALEATLRLHRDAPDLVPVRRILLQDTAAIRGRAERLLTLLGQGDVVETVGFAGGGSLPDEGRPSAGLALSVGQGAEAATAALRDAVPAVVCRIVAGRLVVDMLAVADEEVETLAGCLRRVVSSRAAAGPPHA